jgi:hypothetical protein
MVVSGSLISLLWGIGACIETLACEAFLSGVRAGYDRGQPSCDGIGVEVGKQVAIVAGRGRADYFARHDLEDFVAVIDGGTSILQEMQEVASEHPARHRRKYGC